MKLKVKNKFIENLSCELVECSEPFSPPKFIELISFRISTKIFLSKRELFHSKLSSIVYEDFQYQIVISGSRGNRIILTVFEVSSLDSSIDLIYERISPSDTDFLNISIGHSHLKFSKSWQCEWKFLTGKGQQNSYKRGLLNKKILLEYKIRKEKALNGKKTFQDTLNELDKILKKK